MGPTPLQRLPRNEQGEPLFEQADSPETAWDALVEFSDGDVVTAKEIADTMVEEKRKALEKAQKLKIKGKTPAEMLASKKANAVELEKARAEYEHWEKMAGVEAGRQEAIKAEQEAEALRNQVGQGGDLQGAEPPAIGEQIPADIEMSDRGTGVEDDSTVAGGRGDIQSADERQTDLQPSEEVSANLSEEEKDEYGKPLVLAKDGTTTFGIIDAETGLTEAPIRLSLGENTTDDEGKNHGYGLLHIEAGHGDQIRNAGYASVEEFVEEVAKNYTDIREGALIGENQTYLLEVSDDHNNTLFIQLSKDGTYWNVNSAGIFKKKYSRRKPKVYSVPAVGEGTNTDTSEVDSGQTEGATAPAGNSSQTSDRKDTKSLTEEQVSGEESLSHSTESESTPSVQSAVEAASAEVNTTPTPAQAEAGNYKHGYVTIGDFKIKIENPAGSTRKGVDADGKEWQTTMANTYGEIQGTESTDGDALDVFLATDMDEWNGRKVFVVDQTKPDGSFDEHKIMLGFNDKDEAMDAYLANYDRAWAQTHPGLRISEVNIEDFNKWVESSHRKTKPFSDYTNVSKVTDNAPTDQSATAITRNGYKVESKPYTNKQGKTLDTYLVTFDRDFSKEEMSALRAKAKALKGWYDRETKGWMLRSEADAKSFAEDIAEKNTDDVDGAVSALSALERAGLGESDVAEELRRIQEEESRSDELDKKTGETVLSGKETVSLKPWREMNAQERMDEAQRHPLTENEILQSPTDEVNKANALDYLRGNHGLIASLSYLKVYEDVRNSVRDSASDSLTGHGSQLASADPVGKPALERGAGGSIGISPESLDRNPSQEDVSPTPGAVQRRTDRTQRDSSDVGESGNSPVSGKESRLGGLSSGRGNRGRGGRIGSPGLHGGRGGTEDGDRSAGKDGDRGNSAQPGGNIGNVESGPVETFTDNYLSQALQEFESILDEFKRAGRGELSLSLTGMNAGQMEVLPRLIAAGAKVGYALIRKGYYEFSAWAKGMREVLGGKLSSAELDRDEVDAFIREMWKSKLPMDGQVHTLEEWSSIVGKAELRKKIGTTLDQKRKAQEQAESVAVKVGDRENIASTLPFLLPQQQDDVLKAETQFFDENHNDREHAYGKGYMFTNGTGTGKTYTGLGIVKRFIKQGKGRILILTPSQTKVGDWIKDAGNLGIDLQDLDSVAKSKKSGGTAVTEKGSGAVITTYANFRQNQALLEDDFDLIVYDESHRLLENKEGIGTTGSMQHYKLSNRNENFAFQRLKEINPVWKQIRAKHEAFEEMRSTYIERLKKESGISNISTLAQRGELPPPIDGYWNEDAERRFPQFDSLRNEILELNTQYEEEIKPRLEKQAVRSVRRTKVVFLSATPFNTRENLDYAEGYIFSYPEEAKQVGYATQSPRSQFYLERFGAGYKWRYNRLESSTSNPEALSRQEIEFSDYLQNVLHTMSGRIIDSPYDYSRDFPTVTLDKAEEFNNAMEELSRDDATATAYYKVMGDYNYTTALFESMKVSQIIPRLKSHLSKGRKIVIFHRRVESKTPIVPPFSAIFAKAEEELRSEENAEKRKQGLHRLATLRRKYADMLSWEKSLDLRMPREQLADAFGSNHILFFSGKESKKAKDKAVEEFNRDDSGKDVIVIQEASGKEGISLHDTTGVHQRVLVTLALPQSPITALQIEGRIYRIGNKSNAIFEYPLLGLNTEMMLFGQKFNQQVSTTENLALGSQARNLRESFAKGVEEHSGDVDLDGQGVGGKEFDAPNQQENSPFDNAVLDYYGNQKLNGKRDSREGIDYYPTPEPLGYKMSEWGNIGEGESVLEPSAGHGAIARYVPRENPLTAIEPSQRLFSKLQLKAGGNGRKFENTIFENYNVVNKHDVVLMNPPFGTGGRLAVDHVAKAFQHLEEGGRIVAIIPRGSTDNKFDKWYSEQKNAVVTAEIGLPDITFQRAGTSVRCRVVVIDKVSNEDLRRQAASRSVRIDLGDRSYNKIEDFFDELRDISVPPRTIDQKARLKKKALPVARDLRAMKGVRDVTLTDDSIFVSGPGLWASLEWRDKKDDVLADYLSKQYMILLSKLKYAKESQVPVYDEMKSLACKLAGMTEDEMLRYSRQKSEKEGKGYFQQGGEIEGRDTPARRFATEAVLEALERSGIEVEMATPEMVDEVLSGRDDGRLSARQKRALETVSVQNSDEHLQTAISSASGAKVLENLDTLAKEYEKNSKNNEKTFVGEVADALGIDSKGSSSKYATFETKNGKIVTIRLSNHNATVSNFDNRGEADGISIVVSAKKSEGIRNDGEAHLVEYYYDAIKLRKAEGRPLSEIVRSLQQALYSGEFKDNTGLAERQEVNAADGVEMLRTPRGTVYGWTMDGKIYLTPAGLNPDTPIHEYTHLWALAMQRQNPKGWESIKDLLRGTPVWDEVTGDENYRNIRDNEDEVAGEVLSRISGRENARKLEREAERIAEDNGGIWEKVTGLALIGRMREALKRFWRWAGKNLFGIEKFGSIEEVTDRVLYDLVSGTDLRTGESASNIETVNDRFNEQLTGLTEENADNVTFDLGRPSATLRAAGVEDKPMKLYGNKVIKKMKKHGFELEELQDLPRAVSDPIAVFDNYGKDGNRAILTELRTAQGNFLVTLDLGKGKDDVDFNIISSVFGKGKDNIMDWINTGKATYINKRKALDYLHHSALHAVTLDNEELSHAANVIENFENPTIEDEKNANDANFDGTARFSIAPATPTSRAGELYNREVSTVTRFDQIFTREGWKSLGHDIDEGWHDGLRSLRILQDAIAEESGKAVEDWENVYLHALHNSSVNKARLDQAMREHADPLSTYVGEMVKGKTFDGRAMTYDDVDIYLNCVHGIERNEYMSAQDQAAGKEERADYSGLTAIFDPEGNRGLSKDELKREAEDYIGRFEAALGDDSITAGLWSRIGGMRKFTLDTMRRSGLISREQQTKLETILDEMGNLTMEMQQILLRAVQERYCPVGAKGEEDRQCADNRRHQRESA